MFCFMSFTGPAVFRPWAHGAPPICSAILYSYLLVLLLYVYFLSTHSKEFASRWTSKILREGRTEQGVQVCMTPSSRMCMELIGGSCHSRCYAWIIFVAKSLEPSRCQVQSGCSVPVHIGVWALSVTRWWHRGEVTVGCVD